MWRNRKDKRIDCNFDDLAVNLNTDEIPISGTGRRKVRANRYARRCFPSINSTMESNEAIVVVVVIVVCSRFEGSRRDDRYRNSNTIVKALMRRSARIECSDPDAEEEGNEGNIGSQNLVSSPSDFR